jgi:hypothetical protein
MVPFIGPQGGRLKQSGTPASSEGEGTGAVPMARDTHPGKGQQYLRWSLAGSAGSGVNHRAVALAVLLTVRRSNE